jgi:glycosyltransferase involved in cell wall biosynthesis
VLPTRALAQLRLPIVWTLHDMGPLTGGCHHAYGCTRYEAGCGSCPQLRSRRERDLSSRNARARRAAYAAADIAWIAPSRWLAECARRSHQLAGAEVGVVHPDLPQGAFMPGDRAAARTALDLPAEAEVALLVGQNGFKNPHKGWPFAVTALARRAGRAGRSPLVLLLVGENGAQPPGGPGFEVRSLGEIGSDAGLAAVYSAADYLLMPSLAETFGLVTLEAITCGCPVVAFPTGGLPEVVANDRSGWVVEACTADALAEGIERVAARTSADWRERCTAWQRERFPEGSQVSAYKRLYEMRLARSRAKL